MRTERQKFNIYNFFNRDGKGVEKGDELNVLEKPGFANFFKLLWRRRSQMFNVNLFYIIGNFPFLFALFAISGYPSVSSVAPANGLWTALAGTSVFPGGVSGAASPVSASLNAVYGKQVLITFPTVWTYILIGLSFLLLFTFGLVNTGCTYLLRNMIKGEHIFPWQDFWYAVKRNLKQGIIFGVIDIVISVLLVYDIIFFRTNIGAGGIISGFYFMSFAMVLMYFFMRMYIYPMLITFDLSIFKMFKNAILFTVLGIKRNLMCFLGVVIVIGLNYALFVVFMPIGIILPFIITVALCKYIMNYCSYPVIKKYMIDPYYKEIKKEPDEG